MLAALERIKNVTQGTQYEGKLWLVGGAVRDELLELGSGTDFDIVLEQDAHELAKFLWDLSLAQEPPVTYERFGTAMVIVDGATIELATARKESYSSESRKPDVEPATLREDAERRDFTANTLLKNLHTQELFDPLGVGLDDLRQRVLRTPKDPSSTFSDDPLRMLRAVRFKWKLGFSFAPELERAVPVEASRLAIVSSERIQEELRKMLLHPSAPDALDDLMNLQLLDQFWPEFRAGIGMDQGHYHHLDVWSHTLAVVKNAWSEDIVLTLAALFHDVGKPSTRSIEPDGRIRFFSHETVGEKMSQEMLSRLRFSNEEIQAVSLLVKNHMRLGSSETLTATAARRLIRDLGHHLDRLLDLCEADANGLKAGVRTLDVDSVRTRLNEVRIATPIEVLQSPLSGQEIMEILKIETGPEIGRIKSALLSEVLEGRIQPLDKESSRRFVLEYYSRSE